MKLRIVDHIIETIGTVHQLCRIVARHDPNPSKQMKRAVESLDSARVAREADDVDRVVATVEKLAYRAIRGPCATRGPCT